MWRALLLVVAFSFAGGCSSCKDREIVGAFIAEVRSRMAAQSAVLGAIEIHGNQIELLDGWLALNVRVPHDEEIKAGFHFHVLAIPRDRKAGKLDLCIVGPRHAEAARALVDHALPPLVSAIRHQPLLGAVHAWSDTERGIPGHSVYFGDAYMRGSENNPAFSSLLEGGLFEEAPALPRDGLLHVVKVTVQSRDGDLLRTIELDGATAVETERRLKGKSNIPGWMVAFSVLDDEPDPLNDVRAGSDARQRLIAHPSWLPDPHTCPAKLMPLTVATASWDAVAARGGRLLHAVRGCESGVAQLCYAAAQELIVEDSTSLAAASLFVRACQHGFASGCTNAAAGRVPQDDCSFETYEVSCDRGHDPWGCPMLGAALALGDPKQRDLARARAVLPRACTGGEPDPACERAKLILASLQNTRSAAPEAPSSSRR